MLQSGKPLGRRVDTDQCLHPETCARIHEQLAIRCGAKVLLGGAVVGLS